MRTPEEIARDYLYRENESSKREQLADEIRSYARRLLRGHLEMLRARESRKGDPNGKP